MSVEMKDAPGLGSPAQETKLWKACFNCRKVLKIHVQKLLLCSACGSAWYCNGQCQKEDWPVHKTQCNLIKSVSNQGMPEREWKERKQRFGGFARPHDIPTHTPAQHTIKNKMISWFDKRHISEWDLKQIDDAFSMDRAELLNQPFNLDENANENNLLAVVAVHFRLRKFYNFLSGNIIDDSSATESLFKVMDEMVISGTLTDLIPLSQDQFLMVLNQWTSVVRVFQEDDQIAQESHLRARIFFRIADAIHHKRKTFQPPLSRFASYVLEALQRQAMFLLRSSMGAFARTQHDSPGSSQPTHDGADIARDVLSTLYQLNQITTIPSFFRELFNNAPFATCVMNAAEFLPTALTLLREFSMTSLDGLRLLPSIVSVIQSTEILTVDLVRQIQRNVVALAIGSASYEVVFSETERMILRSLGSSLENDDVPDQDSVSVLARAIRRVKNLDAEWSAAGLGEPPGSYTVNAFDRVYWFISNVEVSAERLFNDTFRLVAVLGRAGAYFKNIMAADWFESVLRTIRDCAALGTSTKVLDDIGMHEEADLIRGTAFDACIRKRMGSGLQPSVAPAAFSSLAKVSTIEDNEGSIHFPPANQAICSNPDCIQEALIRLRALLDLPTLDIGNRDKRMNSRDWIWYCGPRCRQVDSERRKLEHKRIAKR